MTDPRPMPEFSRLVRVEALEGDSAAMVLRANDSECAALAERLGLLGVSELRAELTVRPASAGLFRLNVDFSANVIQSCVVSLDAVEAVVSDHFSLLCGNGRNEGQVDGEEVYVDPFGDDPVEPLEDGEIDVGELIAQHLSLSLDPYPRAPGTDGDALIAEAGAAVLPEEEGAAADDGENPFAALEQWRQSGGGGAA